jgi:hypothetical protein
MDNRTKTIVGVALAAATSVSELHYANPAVIVHLEHTHEAEFIVPPSVASYFDSGSGTVSGVFKIDADDVPEMFAPFRFRD